jgi:hypothetical protein
MVAALRNKAMTARPALLATRDRHQSYTIGSHDRVAQAPADRPRAAP